jgi:hypothetical protein
MEAQVFDSANSLAAKVVGASMQTQVALALIPTCIADYLLEIPATECVYVQANDGMVQVWTIVDAPEESVFDAIYAREKDLIDEFKPIRFDFHVIAREGRQLRSIISLSCQGWRKTA